MADATHFVHSQIATPTGFNEIDVCDLDGKGGGACVVEAWWVGGETLTASWTGSAVPYYTLTVSKTSNGARKPAQKIWVVSCLGFLVSVIMKLVVC